MKIQQTQAITMNNGGKFNIPAETISDKAPNWFRDGVKERVLMGVSIQDALKAMQASPFFDKDWVCE
ncbi:hypothetical protein [Thiomicrorhabdus aquaedulcis]|uniref:hypothetical protein n=1 Tax=Thiomicrorhabdus aquaedulcis TaxID=2211106 RepID=UPI000FD94CEF|nr:hypothetical protein [Thiomicrorhabdus aquaedulcis]